MRLAAVLAGLGLVALTHPFSSPPGRAADQPEVKAAPGWEKLATGPKERYALQTVWDSHKKRLLLFGGESNPKFYMWDDLWAFSPETGKWTELKPEGKKPGKRCYFAACFDLWFFDSEKEAWTKIDVKGAKPSGRDGHDVWHNPKTDELILLGGLVDFQKFEVSDELWVFDIAKSTWSKKAAGPSARFLYCGALDAENQKLYVSGGFGAGGKGIPGDLWVYDIAADKWTSREDKGNKNFAAGRMVHISDENRLLIFGGGDTHIEYSYDTKAEKWSAPEKQAPAPGRSYHSMALDPVGRRVFVFGGTTKGFLGPHVPGDLWVLNLPAKK
jgi:hypothetical protein